MNTKKVCNKNSGEKMLRTVRNQEVKADNRQRVKECKKVLVLAKVVGFRQVFFVCFT